MIVRRLAAPSVLVLALIGVAPTAAQAGFFDSLFGGAPFSQPQPQPYFAAPDQPGPGPAIRRAPRRREASVTAKPTPAQIAAIKATTLMTDKTLRDGDAVMTPQGIRIFHGPIASHHTGVDFISIGQDRRLPKAERAELVAINAHRVAEDDWQVAGEAPVHMGRSVALATTSAPPSEQPPAKLALRRKPIRRIVP